MRTDSSTNREVTLFGRRIREAVQSRVLGSGKPVHDRENASAAGGAENLFRLRHVGLIRLQPGRGEISRVARLAGIPNEFHLYPGGHNWQYFAQHLPASLEFQSRAFGLHP